MKKIILAVLSLGILMVLNACAVTHQRIDQPGYHAEGTNARPPAPTTNPRDQACANLVAQGKASYVRTDNGVMCMVHDDQANAQNGNNSPIMQHGVFENWANTAVNVSVSDRAGMFSRSFPIPPNGYYKIDLPPGEYVWRAQKVTGGDWLMSSISINSIRNDNESSLAGGQCDFVVRIVPR